MDTRDPDAIRRQSGEYLAVAKRRRKRGPAGGRGRNGGDAGWLGEARGRPVFGGRRVDGRRGVCTAGGALQVADRAVLKRIDGGRVWERLGGARRSGFEATRRVVVEAGVHPGHGQAKPQDRRHQGDAGNSAPERFGHDGDDFTDRGRSASNRPRRRPRGRNGGLPGVDKQA